MNFTNCKASDVSGTSAAIQQGRAVDPHAKYRKIWATKKLLKLVYDDYYRRISDACVPGATVEIGGGIGQFKEFSPEAISSDIQQVVGLAASI